MRPFIRAEVLAPPHARGWTLGRFNGAEVHPGFPARAGMDPHTTADPAPLNRLPRTRGDGPVPPSVQQAALVAPPHSRGWTHHGPLRGLA